MGSRQVIEKFGGQSALAALIGKRQSTVSYWAKTGVIPARWQGILLDLATSRGIELTPADFIGANETHPATPSGNENNRMVAVLPSSMAASLSLNLGIEKQIEIDGIAMGVLTEGTPFLTGRGLARLCGVAHSVIQGIATEWQSDDFPRSKRIREIIESHGGNFPTPYIEIKQRSGTFYAYPDAVCLAIMEYYAFDAGQNIRDEAKKNYRLLAGKALRDFIYAQVGYDPKHSVPNQWRQFHDRLSLTYNAVPRGYFGVFKEIADMIVTLGQAGLYVDANFVPDISVGKAWSAYWKENELAEKYGERAKYEHNYPGYFPQSASNPQEPFCYPEEALGEFRRWLRESYIGDGKLKKYIENKVAERALPPSFAQLAIAAYTRD
jgi:hypothetical protein